MKKTNQCKKEISETNKSRRTKAAHHHGADNAITAHGLQSTAATSSVFDSKQKPMLRREAATHDVTIQTPKKTISVFVPSAKRAKKSAA